MFAKQDYFTQKGAKLHSILCIKATVYIGNIQMYMGQFIDVFGKIQKCHTSISPLASQHLWILHLLHLHL